MVSIMNVISCILILTLFLSYQVQTEEAFDENRYEIDGILNELLGNTEDPYDHQQYRRASLRYHPHTLYRKASLKPIIGQNGKIAFNKRLLH